jgi:hypothetical protein
MMVIVSKAVFEEYAPRAKLGAVLGMRVYRSANKHLERLGEAKDSRLFLVTVRPPKEDLWLVAVLESPKFEDDRWEAARNHHPITDIGPFKDRLKFESGKGLQAKKGALGMSLQTPRVLTRVDAELLLQAVAAARPAPRVPKPRPVNVTAHVETSVHPCLCHKCLPAAPETLEREGITFFRASTVAHERILWFWVPEELRNRLASAEQAVNKRLMGKLKPYKAAAGKGTGAAADAAELDDED